MVYYLILFKRHVSSHSLLLFNGSPEHVRKNEIDNACGIQNYNVFLLFLVRSFFCMVFIDNDIALG